ncbi:MAG: HD-GYP domain-containing protein [Bdellovibrionales bacterium]
MKVLAIVFSSDLKALLSQKLKSDAVQFVEGKDKFFEEVDKYQDGEFSAVICEMKGPPEFAMEVGQVMRSLCPQTPSFACALDKSGFLPKDLKKNGFTDAFLFPIDKQNFDEALSSAISPEALAKRAYKRVLSMDLKAKSRLGFTTYVHLPLNNKYLVFANKNEEFSEKKATKLQQHHVGALFIDQKDSSSFFEYVASQMKAADNSLSETEREEKLKDSVRNIFREVFDQAAEGTFEVGRELMDSCRKMVSTYVMPTGSSGDFHSRLMRSVGGLGLDYSHSADVSTIAALFGMAFGSKKVEELAIAGFFHDVALAGFPVEYGYDVNSSWSEELVKTFKDHPQQSLNLVKAKKMILPAEAEKAIFQHHEKFDGTGFPKGTRGERISEEAQILSLADQFHYLTIARSGQKLLQPLEALDLIAKNGSLSPTILNKARALFAAKAEKKSA